MKTTKKIKKEKEEEDKGEGEGRRRRRREKSRTRNLSGSEVLTRPHRPERGGEDDGGGVEGRRRRRTKRREKNKKRKRRRRKRTDENRTRVEYVYVRRRVDVAAKDCGAGGPPAGLLLAREPAPQVDAEQRGQALHAPARLQLGLVLRRHLVLVQLRQLLPRDLQRGRRVDGRHRDDFFYKSSR